MIYLLRLIQFKLHIIFFLPAQAALNLMYLMAWIIQAIVRLTPVKKMASNNLKLVFPDCPADQLADKLIKNTAYSLLEILSVPFLAQKHLKLMAKLEDLKVVDAALAEGKGAILVGMHAGNYELVQVALSLLNYKNNIILRSTQDPLFAILDHSRQCHGAKLINILEKDMYHESLRALNNNELVLMLADTGALESRHEFHRFLGKDVPVATGWLTMAQRANCPIIPVLAFKDGRKNIFRFLPAQLIKKDSRETTLKEIITRFESFITAHPEQWIMFFNSYETERMIKGK